MIKNIIKLFVILLIGVFIGNVVYGIYREAILENGPTNIVNNVMENIIDEENNVQNSIKKNKEMEKLPDEYQGYKVSAKLEIEKINLETYVFEDYDEEAMWICPTKYFGPNPNEIGNYCIAAHNYNKKNMFNNIIKLEKGDNINLTDNINGKITYTVYDVYKVESKDTETLSQQTDGKVELTLITCSDYSRKRIIVKARKL